MRVVAQPDPVALERELLSRLDGTHPATGVGRTLVLVPTTRLRDHVQRRLSEVRPAWLGLRVLTFAALANDLSGATHGGGPRLASALLLEALLHRTLRARPDNRWSAFARRRPGVVGRLLVTFSDLREAGIAPDDLAACADRPDDRNLADLYSRFHVGLGELETRGRTDRAGVARAALPHAARHAETLDAVFVHGAYEILGSYLDLLRELDRFTDVTVLVPAAPGTRVTLHAERFATEFLLGPRRAFEIPEATGDAGRTQRLGALYDETSRPARPGSLSIGFRHAQGAFAEVQYAVRQALRAVREGCPPTEIAITARTLEPYAAALEEALDDAGLSWTSSLGSPLRRDPLVRDFLLLLRVLGEGFPRDATVEILHSGLVRWDALGCEEPPPAADADAWSRSAGVVAGLDEWITALEGPLDSRGSGPVRRDGVPARGRRIQEALRALDGLLPREDATWSTFAETWSSALTTAFGNPKHAAGAGLLGLLESLGELEQVLGERRAVSFEEARSRLDEAVDATRVTLRGDDGGGIRVLDAMQLRGLTFRRVQLLGMNSGLFPRTPQDDPLLPDELRRRLRERSGRPVGIKSEGSSEERLLLALLLGSARERIDVSWQRADESGRARTASLALREVARFAYSQPDIGRARRDAVRIPSHPAQWLDSLVRDTGLLSSAEARLLAALRTPDAGAAGAFVERFPDLRPNVEMLQATQSFEPRATPFDGRIEPFGRDETLSVSALEQLGRCPLQFFCARVLGIEPLVEPSTPFEPRRDELGTRVHELLERVYSRLREENRFAGETEALVARGLALLEPLRDHLFGDPTELPADRLPGLWEIEAARWFATVLRFVASDLRRIGESAACPACLEGPTVARLELDDGLSVRVRGRFDRLLEGPEGRVVGDYKTSTSLADRVNPTRMLKGIELQVPLYGMLAGPGTAVEVLGVHPDLDPADGEHVHRFDGFAGDPLADSFRDTLRVLVRLLRDGVFPFREGDPCRWCDYNAACRRNHPPSVSRESRLGDAADYRRVSRKSRRNLDGR